MEIDIAPYIKELLYKHNNLVIPGFGNFVLSYASTTIDHVQGILNPPSKKIAFDANLLTNDGKLIEHLKEKHQIGTEDATAIINTFVSKIKMQLGKREMVTIPEVGRLYKDFEDDIQFIPDVTNFSKESFGLPTINFYPILRENTAQSKKTSTTPPVSSTPLKTTKKETIATKTTPTASAPTPATAPTAPKKAIKKSVKKGFWDTYFWIPGALLVFLLASLLTYVVYPKIKGSDTVADNRINQKPSKIDQDAPEDPKEDMIDMQMEQEAEDAEEDMIDTESITVNPNQKECIVSIGVFGQKANATNMIQQVYDKGYDAYRDNYVKNGKELTKVGIQFAYETQEEYQRKVNKIKRDFPNAVVIKK